MRHALVFVSTVGVILTVLFAPLQNYTLGLISYACVLAMLGLSVTLTLGHLGYISFGQAAFFGLGAYTTALLVTNGLLSFWPAVLVATVPCALLGVVVGMASVRVGGAYFAIATLTAAEILRLVTLNWVDFTRGPLGMMVPRPRIEWLDSMGIGFQRYYAAICLLALAAIAFGLHRLLRSPWGRAWQAIKEAPALAASVGVNTVRHRVVNIAVSGVVAGLAGALIVPRILVVTPDTFSPMMSATGLLVAIVGGVGSIVGPLIGGVVFAVFPELLRVIDEYRLAVFALLLLLIVRVQPQGLAALWRGKRRLAAPAIAADASTAAASAMRRLDRPLTVEGLSRSFGGLRAVQDVSFRVSPGELIGLIGPNGAGKTTCLTLVSGFLPPSSGTVHLGETVLSHLAPFQVAAQGVVRTFQQATLCGSLSVLDNVLIGSHLLEREGLLTAVLHGPGFRQRERQRHDLAHHCLSLVGLAHRAHDRAADLPYGEQKMLTIAVALAARPALLLLDEPAAGLNHTEAESLATLLLALRAAGLSIVVVDHNLRMMMKLCDRLVVMHHGQTLAVGTPTQIRDNPEVQRAYLGGPAEGRRDAAHQECAHA